MPRNLDLFIISEQATAQYICSIIISARLFFQSIPKKIPITFKYGRMILEVLPRCLFAAKNLIVLKNKISIKSSFYFSKTKNAPQKHLTTSSCRNILNTIFFYGSFYFLAWFFLFMIPSINWNIPLQYNIFFVWCLRRRAIVMG